MDNLWNTGYWKRMAFEILITLIMPYPWEYGNLYTEEGNDLSNGK